MTIMCCWFDQSYSRDRMTGIADARAATEDKKDVWTPLTESTVKLFRLRLNCHALENFQSEVAGWRRPYYQTEIGIGFAGYCFEALTIIALLSRALDQLVVDGADKPKPEPQGILALARDIMARYFVEHLRPSTQHVEFLIFGFSPRNGEPWVGKLVHIPSQPIEAKFKQPVSPDDFYVIGDPQVKITFMDRVEEIRQRIAKQSKALKVGKREDTQYEAALELARLISADKKAIEDELLAEIDDQFVHTVGGVLQKIEVFRLDGHSEVSYSRDDRPHLLDVLSCVGPGLGYVPIGEKMGMSQAFGTQGKFSGFESEGERDGR